MQRALLLQTPGLMDLQRKTTLSPYDSLWNYLVARWEGIAQRVYEEGKPFDQGGLAWHSLTPMVVEAAVIFRLTNREDARQYVLDCLGYLIDAYGGRIPTADDLRTTPRGAGQGNHTMRPKVLSHGEIALATNIMGDDLPPVATDTVLALMKNACIAFTNFEHGLAGYSSGGNVILCQNINAALCALTWGPACSYDGWETVVDNTCDEVRQYLRNGCDDKGFSYEGAGYGLGVMEIIFLFCHMLRAAGWHDDLLVNEPRLRLIPDAYQHMLLPDGRTATDNDSGCAPVSKWWLLMLAREFKRPECQGEWEFIAGPGHPEIPWGDRWVRQAKIKQTDPRHVDGADKTLIMTFLHWDADQPVIPIEHSPIATAVCGEGTGTATFRTSWNRDAIYAAILGGGRSRACMGHAHSDCGHINLAIGDEYLAVDTGRYNWPEDQHSVVLVDGQNAEPLPGGLGMGWSPTYGYLGQFQRHRTLDYCVADASPMKGAIWAMRHFLFMRTGGDDGYVIVLDNINMDGGREPHEYWWQLQCATTAMIDITGDTTATVSATKSRIDCSFFQKPEPTTPEHPHTLSLKQDIKEWIWPYGKEQDASIVAAFERLGEGVTSVRRPRLLAIQNTLSCVLLSVLSPRRNGQPSRLIHQVPVTNGIGIIVSGDGFTDTVLIAPDHKYILTERIKCFSEIAVLRHDDANRMIDTWTSSGEPLHFLNRR